MYHIIEKCMRVIYKCMTINNTERSKHVFHVNWDMAFTYILACFKNENSHTWIGARRDGKIVFERVIRYVKHLIIKFVWIVINFRLYCGLKRPMTHAYNNYITWRHFSFPFFLYFIFMYIMFGCVVFSKMQVGF